jgi:DNA (cytosine-5)-methyltransferase 1
MTRNGQAYELATSALPIVASVFSSSPSSPEPSAGCSLLPTPVAGNFNDAEPLASWQARRARQKALGRNGNGVGTPLSVAVRLLPTPAAGDAAGGCDPATPPGGVRPSGAKKQVPLAAVAAWHLAPPPRDTAGEHLLPTPTVVMTWRTPGGHLAWRHAHGRAMPCELPAAVTLLPTPDTGTSARGHGRRGGRPGNGHQSGQSLDALAPALHTQPSPTPPTVAWGPYEAAVRRWEHLLGYPAPAPVEPGKNGRPRLAAAFAEWLMGIPGWVTGVEGLPRSAQLRLAGNGVVSQQGAAALQMLLFIAARYPATACPGDDGRRAAA